jgi:hypothetical protein
MALRRIFGPERDEVTGEYRKPHNEELDDLCTLPHIVRVMKSTIMWWARHVSRMRERRDVCWVLVVKPEETHHFGNSGVDGRIILRWIFRKWDVGVWTGSRWLRIGTGGRHLLMR